MKLHYSIQAMMTGGVPIASLSLTQTRKSLISLKKEIYSIIIPPALVIVAGELFIFQGRLIEGIALHALNLIGLAVSTIFIKDKIKVDLMQAFFLVSLLRVVDTSMPTFFTLTLYWYPLIYTPMFISIYLVLRYQKPTLSEIGITDELLERVKEAIELYLVVNKDIEAGEFVGVQIIEVETG